MAVIALGAAFQVLQIIVSLWQRQKRADMTGDPWDGRTLEWSVSSPAPAYNFAVIPTITDRDAFWAQKHAAEQPAAPARYEPIELPRNSGLGFVIGAASLVAGFALIWHIWWLAAIGVLSLIVTIVIRGTAEDTEYTIPGDEIARIENAFRARKEAA